MPARNMRLRSVCPMGNAICSEMITKRVLVNETGTVSDCHGWNIKVCFDLVETQDVIDGVRSPEFSFGYLRYEDRHAFQVISRVCSRAQVTLDGAGLHSTVVLNSPDAFTVMGAILEPSI
jgi:hypothetical protein